MSLHLPSASVCFYVNCWSYAEKCIANKHEIGALLNFCPFLESYSAPLHTELYIGAQTLDPGRLWHHPGSLSTLKSFATLHQTQYQVLLTLKPSHSSRMRASRHYRSCCNPPHLQLCPLPPCHTWDGGLPLHLPLHHQPASLDKAGQLDHLEAVSEPSISLSFP